MAVAHRQDPQLAHGEAAARPPARYSTRRAERQRVLTIAALATLGWIVVPWLLGSAPDLQRAVVAGLSVLVMGYPCAVGISAPLSIARGAGGAAERGILMRTGEAFQGYGLVNQIAFDKTGTLTEGRPRALSPLETP